VSVAGEQVERIVALVAELSRRAERGEADPTVAELAARFRVSPEQICRDVVTLTAVSDEAETDWLGSLSVLQQGDRLSITSRGPFRRPVRFTPLELAAIQVGLAAEAGAPPPIAADFAALLKDADRAGAALRVLPEPADGEGRVVERALRAIEQQRVLVITYAGARDRVGVVRAVEPADVVYEEGRYYIVAWCRRAEGWRHFRADRVLDAALDAGTFTPRGGVPDGLEAGGVFHAADEPDAVEVRFSAPVARWIRERYSDARSGADGSALVTFQVADPQWLVRTVLQYGAAAEVVAPPEYRAIMRRAVAA